MLANESFQKLLNINSALKSLWEKSSIYIVNRAIVIISNDQAKIKEENDKATMKEKNDQFTTVTLRSLNWSILRTD